MAFGPKTMSTVMMMKPKEILETDVSLRDCVEDETLDEHMVT